MLILGLVFEGIPLHLLLMKNNTLIAWTVSVLEAYGFIWAVALLQASRLRKSQIDAECLRFQAGLIWESDIRWEIVTAIRPFVFTDESHRSLRKSALIQNARLFGR